MTAFRRFICWNDESVLATTPRDAASLGDGHFQAVHHPLRLRRRRLDQREAGQWVTEGDIVKTLGGALRPDGYLFLPIVGGSGTGKSHLVRWLRDQTRGEPGWETRYLPKNRTGIRQAIEIIIRGLGGPRMQEAREALEAAPAHTESDEVLADRLLDELALLITRAHELPGRAAAVAEGRELQMRRKLQRDLPDVLRDPVVRRKLAARGAVVPRLVGLAIRGRQMDDGLDDDATSFRLDDLPLSFEEIGDASRGARDMLRQLATIPDLQDAAVALINEALPVAEKRIVVSGQVDLVEIFREVRRALLEDEKQLVLFIEDLTVLHGVEREFLDAIVEPAVSDDGVMCGLRVIFAVTEGHFDDLDTVRTRCDDAYWLDAAYGEGGVGHEEAISFLGRYLNSSRVEPATLENAWLARTAEDWVPNACVTCEHHELCHEAFGASEDGFGLYPLNRDSADRFVRALSQERFDPRDVVRELVNRFLLQGAADMRHGVFPSDNMLSTFDRRSEPLSPLLAAEIQTRRPIDHERLINTLRFWSNPASEVAVPEATLKAFALELGPDELASLSQLAPGSATPSLSVEEPTPRPARTTIESRLRPQWRSHFAELSQWGTGRDLSAAATRDLRNLIHKTIISNLEFGATPVHLGQEFSSRRFKADTHIVMVGTVTRQSANAAVIVVDRTETNAAALQGLILQAEIDTSSFSEAALYRRRLADVVETWTATVGDKLLSVDSPAMAPATACLIVATSVVLPALKARTSIEYLSAIFDPSEPPDPIGQRSPRWTALREQAKGLMPRLRTMLEAEFGESRGVRGNVRAVQADRILPIVESFTSKWKLDSSDPTYASFMRAVPAALNEEWDSLVHRVETARKLVDRDRAWPDQTGKVLSVLRAAQSAGRLRDQGAVDELTNLAAIRSDTVLKGFFEADDRLGADCSIRERIGLISSSLPDDAAVVSRFAMRAAAALEGVERDLSERQAAVGGATGIEQAVASVLESTARLLDRVKELGG